MPNRRHFRVLRFSKHRKKTTGQGFLTCSFSGRNYVLFYGYDFLRIKKRLVISVNKLHLKIQVLSTGKYQLTYCRNKRRWGRAVRDSGFLGVLMETERSAETSVPVDQATQNNIAQDLNLRQHRSESLKPCKRHDLT